MLPKSLILLVIWSVANLSAAPLPPADREELLRLALQAARNEKLHEDPDVKRQMDLVLYRAFLDKKIKEAGSTLEPSAEDLKKAYEAAPLVRLRHLALPEKAKAAADKIAAETKKGADFRKTVLKYSRDERAGDLDFRGKNGLPPVMYEAAVKLVPNEVAGPLQLDGAVHLIQLISRKPYAEAYPVYLEFLRTELKTAREKAFLSSVLNGLRRSSE